jgi:hypothetical protein
VWVGVGVWMLASSPGSFLFSNIACVQQLTMKDETVWCVYVCFVPPVTGQGVCVM